MQKENIKSKNYNTLMRVGILFVFFFTLFSFGKISYAYTQGQAVGDTISGDVGALSGLNWPVQRFTANENFTAKTVVTFPAPTSPKSVRCDYYNTLTGSSDVQMFDNPNTISGNIVSFAYDQVPPDVTGACYARNATGKSLTASTVYGFLPTEVDQHPSDHDLFYGTTGGSADYGYYANDVGSTFGTLGVNNIKYYVSGDLDYVVTPPTPHIETFTYATSTQTVNITGYWNVPSDPFVTQQLEFYQESTALGRESFVSVTATTTGTFNFTFPYKILPTPGGATTTAPILETIYFHAKLYSVDSNYYDPFGLGGLDTSLYKTLLDSASATLTELTHDLDLPIGLLEYPEYECAITSITGCLKNAGIWLFYPSSQKIDQFKSLSSDLQTKFPFAYAYGVNQMRQELFGASSTPQTISLTFKIIPGHGTSTLELLSQDKLSSVPYANTVKTILGWVLWLLAIEYIYYRVIRAHDPNTPS